MEGYEKYVEMVADAYKKGNIESIATAAFATVVNGQFKLHTSEGCHGRLQGYKDPCSKAKMEYILSGIQKWTRNSYTKKQKLLYIDWLVNASPFAIAFIAKDPDYILDNRTFVVSPDVPSNIMMGALQSTRRLWEFDRFQDVFSGYVKAGVNPNLAYILCYITQTDNKDVWFYPFGDAHSPFYQTTLNYAGNFVYNKPVKLQDIYSESFRYNSVQETWRSPKDSSVKLIDWLKANFKLEDVVNKPSVNPFGKALASMQTKESDHKKFNHDAFFNRMSTFQFDLWKEIDNAQGVPSKRKQSV